MPSVKQELRRFMVENGILDPTGARELVAFIERRYAIRVEDRELLPENLASLDRLARFVAAKIFEEDQHAA